MDSLLQLIACSGGELLFRSQGTTWASSLPKKGVEKDGKGTMWTGKTDGVLLVIKAVGRIIII